MNWHAAITARDRLGWLQRRRIGASDCAALLGQSRFAGPWDLWRRLAGGDVDDSGPSPAAEAGIEHEPWTLVRYQRQTGYHVVRPRPHTVYVDADGIMSATPDAFAHDGDDWGLVEAKLSFRPEDWGEEQTIESGHQVFVTGGLRPEPSRVRTVPVHYWLQCQHQMVVLDSEWCDLVALLPYHEIRIYRVLRDVGVADRLREVIRAWHYRHVVEGVEPDVYGSDEGVRRAAELQRQGTRTATLHEVQLAVAYATASREAKALYDERNAAGDRLVESAGDCKRLFLPDGGRVTIVQGTSKAGKPYVFPRVTLPAPRRN